MSKPPECAGLCNYSTVNKTQALIACIYVIIIRVSGWNGQMFLSMDNFTGHAYSLQMTIF